MAAEIAGARLVIYADVGHLPVIEAPQRVAADLTALCDAVAAR
jgi:pimeloyl-ACP methyl ester carboxylesterase